MFIICPECRGARTIQVPKPDNPMELETRNCPQCHGAGEVYDPNSRLDDGSDKSANW